MGNNFGPTSGQGNQQITGGQTSFGASGAGPGATQVNLQGSAQNVVNISSALADANLAYTANAGLAAEQQTAQQAESQNYSLASLVAQSNPGIGASIQASQNNKSNYQFITTTVIALAALAGWFVYRKG